MLGSDQTVEDREEAWWERKSKILKFKVYTSSF